MNKKLLDALSPNSVTIPMVLILILLGVIKFNEIVFSAFTQTYAQERADNENTQSTNDYIFNYSAGYDSVDYYNTGAASSEF